MYWISRKLIGSVDLKSCNRPNMESKEVVVEVDSHQSEGEVDLIVEGYGRVINEEESKIFKCKFCDKIFDKYQALGGHMNRHPEEMNRLRIMQYEKLFGNKNSKLFKTINSREHTLGISSYLFNNFNELGDNSNTMSNMMAMEPSRSIQQPWQHMEPFQVWQGQKEPQQLNLPQGLIYDSNLSKGPINCSPVMPNAPNLPPTYVISDAAIDGNFGLPSMDPSSSRLTSTQNNPLPIPGSTSSDAAQYGYPGPCHCSSCISLWSEQQEHLHISPQGRISPTLNWNQPMIPPSEQINSSSYVQDAQGSYANEVDTQEAGAAENIGETSNPTSESPTHPFASKSNHYELLRVWYLEEPFEGTEEPFEEIEELFEEIED